MLNFCTLFDSNFLSRGITMYESLERHCKEFHLYIFAFDNKSLEILKALRLSHASIVSLEEFEDKELLAVKTTRSRSEYCWTCASSTILYVLEKYQVDACTYLDADLYFFSSPHTLINEMGNNSVLITEHRYTPKYDLSAKNGKYCVQFVNFKNDKNGLTVLKWWRNACLEWCFARNEDGKFGDQKYLDNWTEKFEGVHSLIHLGGGVAPWNVQQYNAIMQNDKISIVEKASGDTYDLVFYHFHHLIFLTDNYIYLGEYPIAKSIRELIYTPYLKHIETVKKDMLDRDSTLVPHGTIGLQHIYKWSTLRIYLKAVKYYSNVSNLTQFIKKHGVFN